MKDEFRWMVRFSPRMGERVRMRAAALGFSIAEYLRTTIEQDLRRSPNADPLARLNAEVTLVTGMMVRSLLTQSLGPQEAERLEDWANARATGLIQGELREEAAGP